MKIKFLFISILFTTLVGTQKIDFKKYKEDRMKEFAQKNDLTVCSSLAINGRNNYHFVRKGMHHGQPLQMLISTSSSLIDIPCSYCSALSVSIDEYHIHQQWHKAKNTLKTKNINHKSHLNPGLTILFRAATMIEGRNYVNWNCDKK